jgi:GNAT superfamily N-acetyltransferase
MRRYDMLIRLLRRDDSLELLTELLHRAYAGLGAKGFNYRAVDQDTEMTSQRIARGECYVVEHGGTVVGTAVLQPPASPVPWCDFYDRPEVSNISQLAIEPQYQGRGWGSALMSHLEQRARALGAQEVAVDTSEGAAELIALYQRRGYRQVGFAQWSHTNFRSVLLSERLAPGL